MKQYRGKRKNNKKWMYGWLRKTYSGYFQIMPEPKALDDHEWFSVIPTIVGQQVGCKDKNNKEIYEDDKLKITCKLYNPAGCQPNPPQYRSWEIIVKYPFIKQEDYVYEIIGNIHEVD